MKHFFLKSSVAIVCFLVSNNIFSQTAEWRLVRDSYSNVDPDGAGLAIGSVVFGIDVRAVGGDITDITQASVGFSYQSASALIPTGVGVGPGCTANANAPANVLMGPAFAASGFSYTQASQCTPLTTNTGGQTFNRTAAGTIDNATLQFNLTTAMSWTRMLTITLWTTGAVAGPEGGYAMIHSGEGGTPGELTSYNITQSLFTSIVVNSASFITPIPLGTGTLPVTFTNYDVKCTDKGAILTWATSTEQNSDKFEIQRSVNGTDWTTIGAVPAAGNSNSSRTYQYLDLNSGAAVYRIRQVDLDGRFIYTATRQTNCKASQFDVVLYPVPAKDNLAVVIRSDKAVRTDLQIVDMKGSVLRRIPTQINSGNTNINIVVTELPVGQYLLRSADPAININKKFTIIR
jgi:Secretion system C-terminal sorting domain